MSDKVREGDTLLIAELESARGRITELEAKVSMHDRTEAALRIQLAYALQGWERYVTGTLI